MGVQRLFIKNPQLVGRIGNMTQLGGDFVFGPGALRAEYFPSHSELTGELGPICTFASRMQHAEDREHLGSDRSENLPNPSVSGRRRGNRTVSTLRDRSAPAFTFLYADGSPHRREK